MNQKPETRNSPLSLIALCGHKGVGKTWVAKEIIRIARERGLKAEIANFAGPLKRVAVEALGLNPEHVFGDSELRESESHWKPLDLIGAADKALFGLRTSRQVGSVQTVGSPLTVRECLQILGTEIMRGNWSQGVWIRAFETHYLKARGEGIDLVVADDLRFPDEAAAIKRLGGEIWQVFRPGVHAPADGHESEKHADKMKPHRFIQGEREHIAKVIEFRLFGGCADERETHQGPEGGSDIVRSGDVLQPEAVRQGKV